ncbi:MAG: prepilin-type N-terminal cleavage/methylation domain-containing protein [Verrucomicrobia bacterium]|nr:prepilin-type N-terminal cleavage/methylation domain-containing protein [Verrucomicrobiota bacterium]
MKKKVKQALTLLEVNIAIFITGILLSALWGLYYNWYKSYDKAQKIQSELHNILFAKCRLEQIFDRVAKSKKDQFVFTPEKEVTLCLSYEGGPDPDPLFNKTLRSLLYKDDRGRFCFATWSPTLESRVEVLLDEVSSLEFFFFDLQTASWQSTWKEEIDHLPLWVKVYIKRKGKEETMVFPLRYPLEPILYLEAFEKGGNS